MIANTFVAVVRGEIPPNSSTGRILQIYTVRRSYKASSFPASALNIDALCESLSHFSYDFYDHTQVLTGFQGQFLLQFRSYLSNFTFQR